MTLFYDRLWVRNEPPIEALREARVRAAAIPSWTGRLPPGPAARPTSTSMCNVQSRLARRRIVDAASRAGAAVGGVCAFGCRSMRSGGRWASLSLDPPYTNFRVQSRRNNGWTSRSRDRGLRGTLWVCSTLPTP